MTLHKLACTLGFVALLSSPLIAQENASQPLPAGAHYIEREFHIQVPGSGPQGLDVMEVYINTPGKHPLALLTHGTSDDAKERMQVSPWAYVPQAVWFARRGYVAIAIVRRGYGRSGGRQDGTNGGCSASGSFEESGEAGADDLRNVALYAAKSLSEVDTATIISAGVSTGGFVQVALTAHPPEGLKAAISFAGGRGGDGKGDLCNKDGLLAAYQSFGKRSHTPMLWIYAENDKWFPPAYARQFQAAFERGGGHDRFVLAPPDGDDGHHLYSHVPAWSATVDEFLRGQHLLPLREPYAAPPLPNIPTPTGLHSSGVEGFQTFLAAGPFKAFATNGRGAWGDAAGQLEQALADEKAMTNCKKNKAEGTTCEIVSRGKQ